MEMAPSTLLPLADDRHTFLQKRLEISPYEPLMVVPDLSDEVLQLAEVVLNGNDVWRIGCRVKQHHSRCRAHLPYAVRVMERGIVHNQNRPGLRPATTV